MTDQYRACADKMSGPGRKRAACSETILRPRSGVLAVEKWIAENNKALSITEVRQGRSRTCGYAEVFRVHRVSRQATRYAQLSNAFIDESKNLGASSFKGHAASDMHARAVLLLKKQSSSDVTEYTSIAKALHTLDMARNDALASGHTVINALI